MLGLNDLTRQTISIYNDARKETKYSKEAIYEKNCLSIYIISST